MSEMVERVARAIAEASGERPIFVYRFEEMALAAIKAMREPTPEIEAAMRRAFERQENIWSAGIDAALK